jgi:hypothetical protein
MTHSDRTRLQALRLAFLVTAVGFYAAVFFAADGLRFEPVRDEVHFWPTSLHFSHRALPDRAALQSYPDLITPLAFVLFGQIEFFFGAGIFGGRLLNLALSLCIVCAIGLPRSAGERGPMLAAAGLVLFPYFLGASVHLYTDIVAASFVLLGAIGFRAGRPLLSGLAFVLAISTRQYMVAFPVAFAALELLRSGSPRPTRSLLAQGLAAASLLGWLAFWGGWAPAPALERWAPSTASWSRLFPAHGLYFLACLGLYFVLPEALLFRRRPWAGLRGTAKRSLLIAGALAMLFVAFPPLQNVDYAIASMGYFDRAARLALPDPLRMTVFYAFALATCLRFASWGPGLALVLANALVMLKANVGWDKYVLPLLVVLWYMKAVGWRFSAPAASADRRAPGQAA